MTSVYVRGIGVLGPGLPGWAVAAARLRGDERHELDPMERLPAGRLPATERRRASDVVRLATGAAFQALKDHDGDTANLTSVFASADGDMDVFDAICRTLAGEPPWVSPSRFHNSVHNAAAGYFGIAVGTHGSSTSVTALDETFAAGLVEALAVLAGDGEEECLLVIYDHRTPRPFYRVRHIEWPFATAFLLTSAPGRGRALTVELGRRRPVSEAALQQPTLERLRWGNPAARSLPLLAALASGPRAELAVSYHDQWLHLVVDHE